MCCSFAWLFGFQSKLCRDFCKQVLFIQNNANQFMPGTAPRVLDMDSITSRSKLGHFVQRDLSAALLCGQTVSQTSISQTTVASRHTGRIHQSWRYLDKGCGKHFANHIHYLGKIAVTVVHSMSAEEWQFWYHSAVCCPKSEHYMTVSGPVVVRDAPAWFGLCIQIILQHTEREAN